MEQKFLKSYPAGIPFQVDIPTVPLFYILEEAARKYPENQAISFLGSQLSYKDLKESVDTFASALHKLGVKKDTKIAIMLPNCPQTVIAYYATIRLGAIVVMINPLYVERELIYQLKDSGAEVIVFLDSFKQKVLSVLPETNLGILISTGIQDYLALLAGSFANEMGSSEDANNKEVPQLLCFENLLQWQDIMIPETEINVEKDLAVLQYTGGWVTTPNGGSGEV